MFRFYFVIITGILFNLYYLPLMWYYAKYRDKYTEADCYKVGQRLVRLIKKRAGVETVTTGTKNLPETGGYIMYSNHQGKYDSLGIINSHKQPCTVIMDKATGDEIVPRLFINLLQGKKLDKQDPRQQVEVINQVIAEIKAGRRYLIFPEGGYRDNRNNLQEFHPGSFKIPLKSKCPIVPVAIYDSYKPFGENTIGPVTTQVHYLEPIYYEQYKTLKSKELADLVYSRINEKMHEIKHYQLAENEELEEDEFFEDILEDCTPIRNIP
ncbi:MAG TPA: 1-acyl-sn-glycerol-3-phosphate acyltransferase [Clostridiales bacterium]|nr:1-acyl-sn-glycerol-3-phosphate acyltransferase [Clostridiales bacterium]